MKKYQLLVLSLVFLMFSLPVAASSAVLYVSDDGSTSYGSIQDAIDDAGPGDTVYVRSGLYNEDITLKSNVNVIGEGWETTRIKGSGFVGGDSSTVYANNVVNCRLEGFWITDSFSTSFNNAGIKIIGGAPEIVNNHIGGNWSGISILNGSSAIIRRNLLTLNGNNNDPKHDYGISVLHATPLISNNIIRLTFGSGIYVAFADSTGTRIINNTIVDNSSDGIWCAFETEVTVKNNIVTGNVHGIAASHDAVAINSYNDVWNNGNDYNEQSDGSSSPGTGAISQDPLFILPSGPWDSRAHFLDEGSPCIDAGDPNSIYDDVDGTRNDMGAYGGPDGSIYGAIASPLGFLFTNIGKIPASEITQSGSQNGLVNVSTQVANDLSLFKYTDAPFGGNLWLHGLFGDGHTNVMFYQVLVAPWIRNMEPALSHFEPLQDHLAKIQYRIQPDGTVANSRVVIGPLPNSAGLDGLYLRTHTGFWSHRDLKLIWHTSGLPNGLYDLKIKAYDANYNEVTVSKGDYRLTVRIDNTPVEAEIFNVRYNNGVAIEECGIIELMTDEENLLFDIKAYHPNGFLRDYSLTAHYGKNKTLGTIESDQYVGFHDSPPPYWAGFNFNQVDSGSFGPWQECAFRFRLHVRARTTNGFTHINRKEFNDHYYIRINPLNECRGDADGNGVVDGVDVSILARDYGRTDCTSAR